MIQFLTWVVVYAHEEEDDLGAMLFMLTFIFSLCTSLVTSSLIYSLISFDWAPLAFSLGLGGMIFCALFGIGSVLWFTDLIKDKYNVDVETGG